MLVRFVFLGIVGASLFMPARSAAAAVDPRLQAEWWSAEARLGKLSASLLALSPDGKRMVVHHGPAMVCADLTAGKIAWQVEMKTLHTAGFSPDGRRIVTAEWEGGLGLFDAATGKRLETLAPGRDGEKVAQAGFLPDGRIVILTNAWSYREERLAGQKPDDPARVVQTLRYSLIVWDPATGKEIRRTSEVLTYEQSNIWVWLMGKGLSLQILQEFSRDGRAVRKTVRYIDPVRGKSTPTLQIHKDDDYRLDLSSDGTTLLVMTVGQPPRLLDVATGKVKATLDGHKRLVTAGAFSPDGKLIATVSGSAISGYALAKLPAPPPEGPAELVIWEADTGRVIARQEYSTAQFDFLHVGFSPDGKYVYAITKGQEQLVAWGQLPFDRPGPGKATGLPDLPPLPSQAPAKAPAAPTKGLLVSDALEKLVEELPRSGRTGAQKVEALFLAALGRFPTAVELKRVADKHGPNLSAASLRAVLAELVATPEFAAHVKSLQQRMPATGWWTQPPFLQINPIWPPGSSWATVQPALPAKKP
jgi:hypothetical protein